LDLYSLSPLYFLSVPSSQLVQSIQSILLDLLTPLHPLPPSTQSGLYFL
jgi:hypothetical protein